LLRDIDASRVAAEATIALALRESDPTKLKDALIAAGYLPGDRANSVEAAFALRLMRPATKWYAVPGHRRFSDRGKHRGRGRERPDADQRAAIRNQVNQFTVPPESILIRRMHGVVAIVLHNLRAGADWGAIAAEYLHGEPPATAFGQQEAEFFGRRVR
jgi:hypothetical protein